MPWMPIDRLPEEAKDGREVLVREGDEHFVAVWGVDYDIVYPSTPAAIEASKCWLLPHTYQDEQGGFYTVDPSHFYDFGEGRTMPDAPEGE